MYIVLALVMLVRGFADAIMMRAQQTLAIGASQGYLPPEHYNQIFSAHGTIMIFFMAMPIIIGFPPSLSFQSLGEGYEASASRRRRVAAAVTLTLPRRAGTALPNRSGANMADASKKSDREWGLPSTALMLNSAQSVCRTKPSLQAASGARGVRSEADQFSKGAFELNGVSLDEALGALPNSPSSCSTGSGGDGV